MEYFKKNPVALAVITAAVFLGATLSIVVLLAPPRINEIGRSEGETFGAYMFRTDPRFAQVLELQEKDPDAALEILYAMLAEANTNLLRSGLQMQIAITLSHKDDPVAVFDGLFNIVKNETNIPSIRALALYRISALPKTYPNYDIEGMLLEHEYFKKLHRNATTTRLFTGNICEESNAIFPNLPAAACQAAKEANALRFQKEFITEDLDNDPFSRRTMAVLNGLLERVNKDDVQTFDTGDVPENTLTIVDAYVNIGISYGILEELGYPHQDMAEKYFNKAIAVLGGEVELYPLRASEKVVAQYKAATALRYAFYLLHTKKGARDEDIRKILAPFYAGTKEYAGTRDGRFIRDPKSAEKFLLTEDLAALAKIDPQFGAFLKTRP